MAQTILETLQSVDIPVTMNSYAGTFIDGVEGAAATVQVQSGGVWYTPPTPFQLADGEVLRITRTAPDDAIPTRLIGRPGPNWRSLPDTTWAMPGDVLRIDPDGNLDWENPGSTAGQDGADGADGVGISSITQNGNEITVHLTDGSTQGPFTLPAGAAGAAGVSVTGATINGAGHLILTLSDGSTIDAGVAQGAGGGGGATTLSALTDVDTTGATDGQVMTYDGPTSKWKPKPATGGSGGSGLPAGGAAGKFVGHDGTNPMWMGANLSSQGTVLNQPTKTTQIPMYATFGGQLVTVGVNPVPITSVTIQLDGNRTPSGHKMIIVKLNASNAVVEIVRSDTVMPTTAGAIAFTAYFPGMVLEAGGRYVIGIEATGNGNNDGRSPLGMTTGAAPTGNGLNVTAHAGIGASFPSVTVGATVTVTANTWWFGMTINNDAPGIGKNVNGPLDPSDLPGGYNAAAAGTFLTKTANGPAWGSPFPAATATNQVVGWSGVAWVSQHPLTITYPNYARTITIRSSDGAVASQPLTNSDKARLIVLQSFETTLTYTGRTRIRIYATSSAASSDWTRAYGAFPSSRPVLELIIEDGVRYAFPGVSILNSNQSVLYATVQVIGASGMTTGSLADCTLTFQMV